MVCAKFIFTNYYLSSDINVDVLELGFKYFDLYPALFGSVSSQHVVKRIYLLLPKKNEVGVCPLVRVSVVAVCPPVARTGSPFARDLIAVFKWEKSVFLKAIICCSYKKAWWSTLMQEDLKISRAGFRYTLKIISCLKGQPFPWILAHTSASRTDLFHKNCEQ